MPSTDPFSREEQDLLLRIALTSIKSGLSQGRPTNITPTQYAEKLRNEGACFVTLKIDEQLRGCIGSLIAHRPLIVDVAQNAYAAAFEDPRFERLSQKELVLLTISISVLSKPTPINFESESDLLQQLRPHIDGLILFEGNRRATFLPSVWESLPNPIDFVRHLKQKAGLSPHYWSSNIGSERYTTFSFEKSVRALEEK